MPYVSDEEQAEIETEFGSPSDYNDDELINFEHIMGNLLVERLVKSALQGNLDQFRDYVSQMQSGLGFVENL
jgi:hypothetical protein